MHLNLTVCGQNIRNTWKFYMHFKRKSVQLNEQNFFDFPDLRRQYDIIIIIIIIVIKLSKTIKLREKLW